MAVTYIEARERMHEDFRVLAVEARVYRQGETMFLLARNTVAAALFLSASAATAVEDAALSADLPAVSMLPA